MCDTLSNDEVARLVSKIAQLEKDSKIHIANVVKYENLYMQTVAEYLGRVTADLMEINTLKDALLRAGMMIESLKAAHEYENGPTDWTVLNNSLAGR